MTPTVPLGGTPNLSRPSLPLPALWKDLLTLPASWERLLASSGPSGEPPDPSWFSGRASQPLLAL